MAIAGGSHWRPRGAGQPETVRSVRKSLHEIPHALTGCGIVRPHPQPFRFELKDANVRASNLERGKHDSQLQYFLFRYYAVFAIGSQDGSDDLDTKVSGSDCPMNNSQRVDERLGYC